MSAAAKVVIALQDRKASDSVARALQAEGCETRVATTSLEMIREVVEGRPAVLIFDLSLRGLAPDDVVAFTRQLSPWTRVVVQGSESGMKDADVIEKGVFFYAAGIDASQLMDAVRAGIRQWEKIRTEA